MESNKDEALRCIEIAKKYHNDGNLPQAVKFIEKSLRLYPTDTARDLLTSYENESNTSPPPSHKPTSTHSHTTSRPDTSSPTSSSSSTSTPSSSSPSAARAYTKEQFEAVQRIRKLKDYYEILEISKTATEVEIKKSYRKLALIMHPDKNGAPGAEEAFKAVSKAFACLSDPVSRKQYDLHGHEAPSHNIGPGRHHQHSYGFEPELTPEQIFEMMFGMRPGGGAGSGFRTYSFRTGGGPPRRQQQPTEDQSPGAVLLQFLPILMVLFVLFLYSAG